MIRIWKAGVFVLCMMVAGGAAYAADRVAADPGVDAITAYTGTWKVDIEHVATAYSKAAHDRNTLRNDCWKSGGYFACNQYVDGASKVLLVFTFDSDAKTYTSYQIPADGSAAGSGKLQIQGNVWTFPWEVKEGDKTTWFRVVNVFQRPDQIEFRQEFSTDKVKWTQMAHGIETKVPAAAMKP